MGAEEKGKAFSLCGLPVKLIVFNALLGRESKINGNLWIFLSYETVMKANCTC